MEKLICNFSLIRKMVRTFTYIALLIYYFIMRFQGLYQIILGFFRKLGKIPEPKLLSIHRSNLLNPPAT